MGQVNTLIKGESDDANILVVEGVIDGGVIKQGFWFDFRSGNGVDGWFGHFKTFRMMIHFQVQHYGIENIFSSEASKSVTSKTTSFESRSVFPIEIQIGSEEVDPDVIFFIFDDILYNLENFFREIEEGLLVDKDVVDGIVIETKLEFGEIVLTIGATEMGIIIKMDDEDPIIRADVEVTGMVESGSVIGIGTEEDWTKFFGKNIEEGLFTTPLHLTITFEVGDVVEKLFWYAIVKTIAVFTDTSDRGVGKIQQQLFFAKIIHNQLTVRANGRF